MDFFEEEPKQSRPTRSGGHGPEPLLARRAVAIGAFLLIFLLLVLGIRGCLGARKDRAIKSYVSDSAELVNESAAIGDDFFALLKKPGNKTPLDLQNGVNSFRASADQLVERARKLSTPGELEDANRWLAASLEFRRDGLAEVARLMTSASAKKSSKQAVDRIAGQMQAFMASDVLYLQRYVPDTIDELRKRNLDDEVKVPQKRFLNDTSWLLPDTVAERLGAISAEKAAPGLHGVALTKVTVDPDGTELSEDQTTTVSVSRKLAFAIEVQNQGDNEEMDVTVRLRVDNTELEKTIGRIAQGETETVTVPLSAKAPSGPTTVDVKVGPVPGEKLTDNNKATYPVVFQR